MIPPALIVLRFGRMPVPLPVVLVWPLILLLMLLATALLPVLPIRGTTAGMRLRVPLAAFLCLCALRGLRVHVRSREGKAFHMGCW
ncbi:MAG: hypothetical protein ACYS8K_08745 [Planctomycetota bacterium]|jgi:hypothetical protein